MFLKFLRNIEKIIPTAHNHAPSGSPGMPEYTKLIQYFFFTISYTENRDWKNFIHYLKKKKNLLSVPITNITSTPGEIVSNVTINVYETNFSGEILSNHMILS